MTRAGTVTQETRAAVLPLHVRDETLPSRLRAGASQSICPRSPQGGGGPPRKTCTLSGEPRRSSHQEKGFTARQSRWVMMLTRLKSGSGPVK